MPKKTTKYLRPISLPLFLSPAVQCPLQKPTREIGKNGYGWYTHAFITERANQSSNGFVFVMLPPTTP